MPSAFTDRVHSRNCHQITVDKDRVNLRDFFEEALDCLRTGSVGEISVIDEFRIDLLARFQQSTFITILTMLHFQFVGWTSNKTNLLPSQANQMFCGQLATVEIIPSNRAIFLFWLRYSPDDKRSTQVQQRLDMALLASGSHQDKPIHAASIEILMCPFCIIRIYMDDQQIIFPTGQSIGDATHNLQPKQVCHREILMIGMRDKCDRATLLHAQATGWRVDLKIMLPGNGTDAGLRLLTD